MTQKVWIEASLRIATQVVTDELMELTHRVYKSNCVNGVKTPEEADLVLDLWECLQEEKNR